jgi:hypothetical protein
MWHKLPILRISINKEQKGQHPHMFPGNDNRYYLLERRESGENQKSIEKPATQCHNKLQTLYSLYSFLYLVFFFLIQLNEGGKYHISSLLSSLISFMSFIAIWTEVSLVLIFDKVSFVVV